MWHLLTKGHFPLYEVIGYDEEKFNVYGTECLRCEHE